MRLLEEGLRPLIARSQQLLRCFARISSGYDDFKQIHPHAAAGHGVGVDHVPIVLGDLVVHVLRGMSPPVGWVSVHPEITPPSNFHHLRDTTHFQANFGNSRSLIPSRREFIGSTEKTQEGIKSMIIAVSSVLIFAILLTVYPYVIYPLILRLLPTRPLARDSTHRCSVTMLFCAYNEGAVIREKLSNIERLKARYPDLQVLAFDDGSSDDTYLQLAARQDLLTVFEGGGRNGKAHGMKRLATMATGDILIFTDANVILDEDAINNLMAWYVDPDVGGICGTLKYLGEGDSATAAVGGLYWRIEEKIKSEESRTGNVMGGDGSIFSLRRALYPSFPDTLLDDFTVSMAAVFAGKRLIKVEDVIAYERLVLARGDEFRRKIRIAARAYHTHLVLKPSLDRMSLIDKLKYASHKFIRWFGGAFMILGVVSGLALAFSLSAIAGLGAAALLAAGATLALRATRGPISAISEIGLALIATLIGVIMAMRGAVFVTWATAKSR